MVFVSNFRSKANLFNDFFCVTTYINNNGSSLPPFAYKTNAKITSFYVTQKISLMIKILDSKNANGCENIALKMTQTCCESIAVPLKLITETSLW